MRVAITYPYVNRVGGVERVVVEAANELVRTGHEVRIYASTWAEGVLDARVQRHHVPCRPRPDLLFALQYRRRCTAALRATSGWWDVHATFSALAPLGGVFWTPSVHREAYRTLLARRGPAGRLVMAANPYHRVRLHMERQLFAPGGHGTIVALSERIKAEVQRHYGVPDAAVVVHPQGFDPAQFNPERRARLRPDARARHGFADGERVVAFVANELERKGFDTLAGALAALDGVRLLAVGRVDEGRARALAAAAGVDDRVVFAGSSEDVAAELAAADAFALPTRYEPWGLVIAEALAAGLPTVTTALAGAAIAVRDGETGRLLDDPDDPAALADALRWALAPGHDPAAISASVGWLRWEAVVARYAEILAASVRA